jgi:hypothetical protein
LEQGGAWPIQKRRPAASKLVKPVFAASAALG